MDIVSLPTLDYALMGIYMFFLIGMGLYYRRFAQESLDNYFLGVRKMKGWTIGTSYPATCMNADVAIGSGIIGLSVLYIGRWKVALVGGGLALVLGLAFRRIYAALTQRD